MLKSTWKEVSLGEAELTKIMKTYLSCLETAREYFLTLSGESWAVKFLKLSVNLGCASGKYCD